MFKHLINNKQELTQIYKQPVKEKTSSSVHTFIHLPNVEHQMDVLYLPLDPKYKCKYCLLMVDVYNGLADFRAIPELSNKTIVVALDDIYEKSKLLSTPKMILCDGEFNNNVLKQWCETNQIGLRIAEKDHHRQLASINNLCRTYGRVLWKMQIDKEITTKTTNREWVDNCRKITDILNKSHVINYKIDKDGIRHDKLKTENVKLPKIIQNGVRVRLLLTHPQDYQTNKNVVGSFRSTDHRWSKQIYTIDTNIIDNHNNVLYKLNNVNHFISREQLQIV